MRVCLPLVVIFSFPFTIVASEEKHVNFLLGSDIELKCTSSFTPSWNKIDVANGGFHIIGLNGERHPNWKDSRYSFSAENSNHFLRISNLRLNDAGKFLCGSDSPITLIVTVLRYDENGAF